MEEIELFNSHIETMTTTAELVQYEGFNPVEFKKTLKKIEPDDRKFGKDLSNMIQLYVSRGTRLIKSTQRMSDDGRKLVLALQKKYRITDETPTSPKDVTLARIGASYPMMCAMSLNQRLGKITGDTGDLPNALAFPAGASLIPKEATELFKKWKVWRANFSAIINDPKANSRKSKRGDADYDEIIWNSNLYTNAERKECMTELGITY